MMLDAYQAPFEVFAGIVLLSFAVAFVWVRLFGLVNANWRRTAGWCVLALMLFELMIAARGYLQNWDQRPPPFMAMMACLFAVIIYLSRRFGPALATLPYVWLIGLQAFRLPLELVMHRAATASIMPNAMSYSGWNFDILTGTSAVVVAWLAWHQKAPRAVIWAWNLMGSVLLVIVVLIAIAATPIAHRFGYDEMNTWVGYPPFVWLPGVLVPAAALGHLVIWRKLVVDQDQVDEKTPHEKV
jgi:hypothetical protein